MKTVILSDIHLGKFWKSNNSAFSRARKLIQNFKYNIDIILDKLSVDNEPINLIIAGDVYDSVNMNTESLIYIKQTIFESLQKFKNVFIIGGNHEVFIDREGNQQTLLDVCMVNNARIYNKNIYRVLINNVNYIFIPFQQDIEKQFEVITNNQSKLFDLNRPNIILSHMTPKEIFSFEKFKMNEFIDTLDIKPKYIILGHYHLPKNYIYKDVEVISIGNTYYLTLDDIRRFNTDNKRYFILDEQGNMSENSLVLPIVHEIEVTDQVIFDNEVSNNILSNINKEDIIYLKSKVLIDYSKITIEGYDVYFELIEDPNNKINLLQESSLTELNNNSNTDTNTLTERWNRYTHGLMGFSENELKLANWLFSKREDEDINSTTILEQLSTYNTITEE